MSIIRAIETSENLREGAVSSNVVGIICPIEIGLTDLPKSEGAIEPPAPPGTTPLMLEKKLFSKFQSEL